jgi:iron complex transport system substrate-binding protein
LLLSLWGAFFVLLLNLFIDEIERSFYMKRNKILALLLSFLTLALLAGCSKTGKNAAQASPVTDMRGRTVTFDEPIEKIVALTPSDCEILYAIGAGELLVGRGEYCDYPEAALQVPSVQSGSDTNIEQIIALKPQLVIMSDMAQTEEQINSLENAGIKVVVTDANDIEGVYAAISLIGSVVGKETEAASLIESMKATFTEISEKAAGDGTKTIYFEVSPLEYGLWTAGTDTFMDELAVMLGLTNIFSDVSGWGEVSQEQVIERNPDYIVTSTMYFGEGPTPVEEILGRAGWQDITALKNAAVFSVDSNAMTRPGPRLAEAIQSLYTLLYGNEAA